MTGLAPAATIDPLAAFIARAGSQGRRHPVPLVATRLDVAIEAGFAVVTTTRTFRNIEPFAIEATLTFPVPIHAVLFSLEARIGGRLLKARAQRRDAARAAYEAAIASGHATVLHEQLMPGIHMLSVGQLATGAEIEVAFAWAAALARDRAIGRLRIPTTVGDIYGSSGLPDSDELVHGGAAQEAELTVACSDGPVTVRGAMLEAGRARLALDRPIDLEVANVATGTLHGRAADGRSVLLQIAPHAGGDDALDVAILVDRSGSMAEACTAAGAGLTKHRALVAGLQRLAQDLRPRDTVDLWQFDTDLAYVGAIGRTTAGALAGDRLRELIALLAEPGGGTEIGTAVGGVISRSVARDLLVITDGKSQAIDVQALVRPGRRIAAVLVGDDSLEANVGHLAALTGGDLFIAAGADLESAMAAALRFLRSPHERQAAVSGTPAALRIVRGHAVIDARWESAHAGAGEEPMSRAVAAYAAGLAVAAMDPESATAFAEAEALVGHLTSLVLVDEAGQAQNGVPATRKVALPTPAGDDFAMACAAPIAAAPAIGQAVRQKLSVGRSRAHAVEEATRRQAAAPTPAARLSAGAVRPMAPQRGTATPVSAPPLPPMSLYGRGFVDWDDNPDRLLAGDVTGLDAGLRDAIQASAAVPDAVSLAASLGMAPTALIVGLLAAAQARRSRTAGRIATALRERASGAGEDVVRRLAALAVQIGL